MKHELVAQLRAAGHDVLDFGAERLNSGDDYTDYVVPLAQAVTNGNVDRGVAVCGSGVGASVCVNKIPGIRAALIEDHYSAHQRVEHDDINIICLGGRAVAWNLAESFLSAEFSGVERHRRRLAKVAALEKPFSMEKG